MTRAADIPDQAALLCESCGYTLHAVDRAGNCPECGTPISESDPGLRKMPRWEAERGLRLISAWLATSVRGLFQPSVFFRTLALPGQPNRSAWFRRSQHFVAAVLLGSAAWLHADRFGLFFWRVGIAAGTGWAALLATLAAFIVAAYLVLAGLTRLVARLSAWEAAYRGLRLPRPVVDRALDYHAVHLTPPGFIALLTTAGYALLERYNANLAGTWVMTYLVVLAAEVVLAAVYLFLTYWKAMRNLMYANPQLGTPAASAQSV